MAVVPRQNLIRRKLTSTGREWMTPRGVGRARSRGAAPSLTQGTARDGTSRVSVLPVWRWRSGGLVPGVTMVKAAEPGQRDHLGE